MNNPRHSHKHSYYNQFFDGKEEAGTIKNRQKLKNFNNEAIKIVTNRLPSDFFRPFTRENQTIDVLRGKNIPFDEGMKTPCFGQQRKQSHSMSLIPKQKPGYEKLERMETLPVSDNQRNKRKDQEYSYLRKLTEREETSYPQRNDQYSYRHPKNYSEHDERVKIKRETTHRSTERQKIKYNKKLTLNEEIKLQTDKTPDNENKIRLNIRKFFREGPLFSNTEKSKALTTKNPKNLAPNRLPPLVREPVI